MLGNHFGGWLLHAGQKKRNDVLKIRYMKMDLQGLSLSKVGPQSIWDSFVTKEGAK